MVKEDVLRAVGEGFGAGDVQGGLKALATFGHGEKTVFAQGIVRGWALREPEAAAKFVAAYDATNRAAVGAMLTESWAKTDPQAALAWAEHLTGQSRSDAVGAVVQQLAAKDLAVAGKFIGEMAPGAGQRQATVAFFQQWFAKSEARPAALAWLETLPAEQRQQAVKAVEINWMGEDRKGFREFMAGPSGGFVQSFYAREAAAEFARESPAEAAQWAARVPGKNGPAVREGVLHAWLSTRTEEALQYAGGLPEGTEREAAVNSVAKFYRERKETAQGGLLDKWFAGLPTADLEKARKSSGNPALGKK